MSKLKGHVKISLTDINTHETLIYEGDNLVTNAISDLFSINPMELRKYLPIADFTKGIVCFNKPLTSTKDDYIVSIQADNEIIAHHVAEQVVDYTTSSITMTYEWGASQGNGDIAAIALGSGILGEYGNDFIPSESPVYSLSLIRECGLNINTYSPYTINESILSIHNNFAYSVYVDGVNITLYKTAINFDTYRLTTDPNRLVNTITTAEIKITSLTDTQISDNNCAYHFDWDNNQLLLFTCPDIHTLIITSVDLQNNVANVTSHTFDDISLSIQQTSGINQAIVEGNFIYTFFAENDTLVCEKINFINDTHTRISRLPVNQYSDTYSVTKLVDIAHRSAIIPDGSRLIVYLRYSYIIIENNTYRVVVFSDFSSQLDNLPAYGYTPLNNITGLTYRLTEYSDSGELPTPWKILDKNYYLTTKYNLPEPITKTNQQKMKIEYTLTEVPENG